MGGKRGPGRRYVCVAQKKIGCGESSDVSRAGLAGMDLFSRGPTTKAGSSTCRASSCSPPIPPSRADPEQIGLAALPVAEEGLQSYSCAGGWNLFMNANTRDPDAAYEFIGFLSAPEQ